MNKLIIILALLISGCAEPMTNQEIITAVKECADAGHKTVARTHYYRGTMYMECSRELLEATQ